MSTPRSSTKQYQRQQVIAGVTVSALQQLWAKSSSDFDVSYQRLRGRMLETLQLGRAATVHAAIPYMSAVLAETKQPAAPAGAVIPGTVLSVAPNGLPVAYTLDALPVKAKRAVSGGASWVEARAAASAWLSGVALTMLADTRRDVFQLDMISRPRVTGYVRMLNPPSCDRCAILAGKRYLWNEGFQRHPNCDCIHIPASENIAGDLTTDPYQYFKSLSERDQDHIFGKANAQAIRDGADIYRVTNVRMRGLSVAGRDDLVRYGGQTRRTVADIYARDRDRRFVIENLQYHGYITGPQVVGGVIRGNDPASQILAGGRGIGSYTVGGQTVTTSRAARFDALMSGTRDPLNRSTMTASEKRLYDAHYRAQWADAGYHPNSVGANSADRGLGLRPVTPVEAERARSALQDQLARVWAVDDNGRFIEPDQVRNLATLLGL